ncbi:uncharacterized protein [Diadema setosum]|uniref:uncharacterized protein n=1 Tax=Diadema setosum TaxID=31175 RepID=UPI003B3AA82C
MIPLLIGAWDVRTLLDRAGTKRPERKTAVIATELARYMVQIAALSETRLADESQMSEVHAGYTFFWIGRKQDERREAGVGFAIKSSLVNKLAVLPKGFNDRLMTVRLPLTKKQYATMITTYAPTMTSPDDVKERFYENLQMTISAVPNLDKLIILADFNARVGTTMLHGKESWGKMTTWMHPRSKHWHLLDYIIGRQKDRQEVRVTKAMCSAECWTDHRLLISELSIRIQPRRRPQGKKALKRLEVSKLERDHIKQLLIKEIDCKLQQQSFTSLDVESDCILFRSIAYDAASETVGPITRKHQDWFDDNNERIQSLLEEKHRLHRTHLNDPTSASKKAVFCNIRRKVQLELRQMQDAWFSDKADEIQSYADRNDMKNFYGALKTVYGPISPGWSPLLIADGNVLITDQKKVLERWAEHFRSVLNRPSVISEEAIARLPPVPINNSLADIPTEAEVEEAVKHMSCGKAPGAYSIPAEIYASGGKTMIRKLSELFQSMWHQEKIPQELKDASIVHLHKRKANRQVCDNHRGISLLSVAGSQNLAEPPYRPLRGRLVT